MYYYLSLEKFDVVMYSWFKQCTFSLESNAAGGSSVITLATDKIDLERLNNWNLTLIIDAQFFYFLVLLKNYDRNTL